MSSEQGIKDSSPLHKEFQSLLDKEFKELPKENQIIKATVSEITKNYVILDIKNAKMEGMIPIEEFKDELSKLKVGSTTEIFIDRLESFKGEIIVSRDKARRLGAWNRVVKAFENQEEITGEVRTRIKGGYIFYAFDGSLPCFLPSSQLDTRPLKKVDHLLNTKIKVLPVRLDKARGNCSVSRRAVLEKSKNAEITEALKEIKENDIVTSQVHAINEWGVFCTYKSIQMLVHVSDLSHSRVKKPSDLVSIGDQLKVRIIKIDKATNRVSASVKALTEDPFENIEKKYKVGEVYEGTVSKIVDYGAFISIDQNVEGLCHSSMMDWTNRNVKPSKIFSVSQKAKFKIVSIEKESKRISLSYKDNGEIENPWNKVKDQIGKEVKIKITNITDKAIFAELIDTKLSGMLHFKELDFNENVENLKKYKKNDVMSVKIIEIKDEKIRFSKRALEKDPLNWFKENKKKEGDIITTRIHEVLKTGVKVAIDKDKKLIATIRKADLAKDTADQRPEVFSPGNALDAKIVSLDLKLRSIKLSVKQAQLDEEKTLIQKFGENATKSGATLAGIFKQAMGKGKKGKKDK